MKPTRLKKIVVIKCAERERLRNAFTGIYKEYSRMQDRMKQVLKRTGRIGSEVFEFEEITKRLLRANNFTGDMSRDIGAFTFRKES